MICIYVYMLIYIYLDFLAFPFCFMIDYSILWDIEDFTQQTKFPQMER